MVQLDGTYEFVSEENYSEYLKSLGLPDESVQKLAGLKTPIVIRTSGSNVIASYAGKEVTFELGKEVEHSLGIGPTVKTIATINGDTITFKTKLSADGSLTEEKVLKFSDDGVVATSTNSKGGKTVRKYKRT